VGKGERQGNSTAMRGSDPLPGIQRAPTVANARETGAEGRPSTGFWVPWSSKVIKRPARSFWRPRGIGAHLGVAEATWIQVLQLLEQRKVNRRMCGRRWRLRRRKESVSPQGFLQALQLRKQLQRIQDLSDLLKSVYLLRVQHPSCA
jgi:hypothetical protein